jgi:hypothetical protein
MERKGGKEAGWGWGWANSKGERPKTGVEEKMRRDG